MPVAEVTDVRELKRYLHRLRGFPPRFRQRLLLPCGQAMDDSAKPDSSTDLELVLLNWSEASQMQAEVLRTAAENGSASGAPRPHKGLIRLWALRASDMVDGEDLGSLGV